MYLYIRWCCVQRNGIHLFVRSSHTFPSPWHLCIQDRCPICRPVAYNDQTALPICTLCISTPVSVPSIHIGLLSIRRAKTVYSHTLRITKLALWHTTFDFLFFILACSWFFLVQGVHALTPSELYNRQAGVIYSNSDLPHTWHVLLLLLDTITVDSVLNS